MIKRLFILCLIANACQVEKQAPLPNIEYSAFLDLIVDIHYAEAALENLKMLEQDSLKVQYYAHILRYHEVTKEQMEQYMEDLRNNPEYLNRVYKDLYTKISSN